MNELYYLIPWPESQKWSAQGGCYPGPDDAVFVPREYIDVFDINGDRLEVGNKVYWHDPELGVDTSRMYEIYKIDEIVSIADQYGEADVYPGELELIKF